MNQLIKMVRIYRALIKNGVDPDLVAWYGGLLDRHVDELRQDAQDWADRILTPTRLDVSADWAPMDTSSSSSTWTVITEPWATDDRSVCPNCGGAGTVMDDIVQTPHGPHETHVTCPECDGRRTDPLAVGKVRRWDNRMYLVLGHDGQGRDMIQVARIFHGNDGPGPTVICGRTSFGRDFFLNNTEPAKVSDWWDTLHELHWAIDQYTPTALHNEEQPE